jgi:hypothetical protein
MDFALCKSLILLFELPLTIFEIRVILFPTLELKVLLFVTRVIALVLKNIKLDEYREKTKDVQTNTIVDNKIGQNAEFYADVVLFTLLIYKSAGKRRFINIRIIKIQRIIYNKYQIIFEYIFLVSV